VRTTCFSQSMNLGTIRLSVMTLIVLAITFVTYRAWLKVLIKRTRRNYERKHSRGR